MVAPDRAGKGTVVQAGVVVVAAVERIFGPGAIQGRAGLAIDRKDVVALQKREAARLRIDG